MNARKTGRLMSALVLVGAAGTASLMAPVAAAQERTISVTTSLGDGPGTGSRQISKKSFEMFCQLMGLAEEQKESAKTVYEGYQSAYGAANTERREQMSKLQRQAQDEDDHSVFMEKMPEIMQKHSERTKQLDQDFLSDLKLLGGSSPEADSKWERVERARRRELVLRSGAMSGEGIDLVEIVREFSLDEKDAAPVQGAILEYEAELDKHLQVKERMLEEQSKEGMNFGKMEFDLEKMQQKMAEMREVGSKVKDTNEKHARKITDLLPEDRREAFSKLVRSRSFPRVYKESKAAKDLKAALALPDLSADQRQSLEALRASFEHDLAPINDAWAAAIEAKEKSGNSGMLAGGGGAMMVLDFGDEPEEIKTARQSKKDLERRTRDRIESTLTPEQKEKLPKESPAEEEAGGAMFITGGQAIEVVAPASK